MKKKSSFCFSALGLMLFGAFILSDSNANASEITNENIAALLSGKESYSDCQWDDIQERCTKEGTGGICIGVDSNCNWTETGDLQ